MADAWLLTVTGLHVPLMPFVEVLGKAGTVPSVQIVSVVPKSNRGVMFAFTVTVKVAGVAHCPAVGVNVYVFETWLLTAAAFQLPVIPLSEVTGRSGTLAFAQIVNAVPKLNTGVIFGLTVTLKVAVLAHCPAAGVKV